MKSVDQVDLFITSHGGNEQFEFACILDRLLVRNLSEIVQVLVYHVSATRQGRDPRSSTGPLTLLPW
jgi:hypothetical protein